MSTELVEKQAKPLPPMAVAGNGFKITNFDEAWRFACAVSKSRLAPKDFKDAQSIMIAVQYGAELGLSPMQSLANIAIINNKACIYGDAMKAVIEASPVCEWVHEKVEGEGDSMVAICEAKRYGRPEPTVRRFSMSDAKRAGLAGGNVWQKYPQRMLQFRARSWALRDQFADLLCGIQMAEEVQDYPPEAFQSGETAPESDLTEVADSLEGDPFAPQPEEPTTFIKDNPAPERETEPADNSQPPSSEELRQSDGQLFDHAESEGIGQ